MRVVIVYEWWRPDLPVNAPYEKREIGKGVFHRFGVDFEFHQEGVGNFSTAIVEMEDGSLKNIQIELIQFIKILELATTTH